MENAPSKTINKPPIKPIAEPLVIPAELGACQAVIIQMADAIQEQQAELDRLQAELEAKQKELDDMIRLAFQRRSERYIEDPDQLTIDFGESPEIGDAVEGLKDANLEAAEAAPDIVIPQHTRSRTPRSEVRPNLPQVIIEVPLTQQQQEKLDSGELVLIGHDETFTMVREPAKLYYEVRRYPKLVAPGDPAAGVISPPRRPSLVEGDLYDTSIAAEIICLKYGYHLPIYRQQDYFAGSGWTPSRSTLLNILTASAEVVRPFIEYLADEVRRDPLLGTDETRVTLLLPPEIPPPGDTLVSQRIHEVMAKARAEGKPSVTARMWAYRGVTIPVNVFDFTVSRHRDGPDAFLVDTDYAGILLADCYSGYQGIAMRSNDQIIRAACVAHARRKFFDARATRPLLASQFLAMFQELYDIEDRASLLTPDSRLELRQAEAPAIWTRMDELLNSPQVLALLPKEKFVEATTYLRNQWTPLQTYLTDGRLPIDNNLVEQLMKQVALGRKNWLFIGSMAAGARAADFITLVSSALRNDLDVEAYLNDLLTRLLAGDTDYDSLRPDHWATEHPEAIRRYRQEERKDTSRRKQARRQARRDAK